VTGPAAQTAAVRLAVRRALEDVAGPVAAAVSGGADSLALAAGLAFERPGAHHRVSANASDTEPARLLGQAREEFKGPLEVAHDGLCVELPLHDA